MTEDKMLELWDKSGGDIYVYADLVADHEREDCAKMCDYVYDNIVTDEHIKDMAFKIRARGEA